MTPDRFSQLPINPPGDITVGEVWRGMADIRHDLSAISAEVRALPAALAKELDDRSVQRVESLKTETDLRLSPLENRIARLERIVWGVITFVFVADGGALMALIIKR